VANAHQDLKEATADRTGSIGADVATFSSTADLLEEDGFFRGTEVYFSTGANVGLTRRVYDSDYETQTITIIPTLPFAPQIGDHIEIYNQRGFGRRRSEYKSIINRVIREASGNFTIPAVLSSGLLFTGDNTVAIGEGLDVVCGIEYWDATSAQFIAIKRAVKPGRLGWWKVPGSRFLGLSEDLATGLTGYEYAIRGFVDPTELVNDTDATSIDPEWLVESAAGIIQMSNRGNDQNLAPGQYMRNRADAVRAKMVTTQQPNCVRLDD
jgi:hypothetical protein